MAEYRYKCCAIVLQTNSPDIVAVLCCTFLACLFVCFVAADMDTKTYTAPFDADYECCCAVIVMRAIVVEMLRNLRRSVLSQPDK